MSGHRVWRKHREMASRVHHESSVHHEKNEEDSCFGHYPDNECDAGVCEALCEDIDNCKKATEMGQ